MQKYMQFVVLMICLRVLPHPANVFPAISISLFSGIIIASPLLSLALPLCFMLSSDLILGLYASMPFNYAALLCTTLIGMRLKQDVRFHRVIYSSVFSALLFYGLSNLGVWYCSTLYPHTLIGLVDCYVAAIPFFQHTLFSAVGFSALFWLILRPNSAQTLFINPLKNSLFS